MFSGELGWVTFQLAAPLGLSWSTPHDHTFPGTCNLASAGAPFSISPCNRLPPNHPTHSAPPSDASRVSLVSRTCPHTASSTLAINIYVLAPFRSDDLPCLLSLSRSSHLVVSPCRPVFKRPRVSLSSLTPLSANLRRPFQGPSTSSAFCGTAQATSRPRSDKSSKSAHRNSRLHGEG